MRINKKVAQTAVLAAIAASSVMPAMGLSKAMGFRRMDPSEVGRPEYRHKNPVFTSATEGDMYVYRKKLWDYYGVIQANILTTQTLFSTPKGQPYTPSGGTQFQKTFWHTNLVAAGSLGQPNKAFVMGIGWGARTNIAAADAVHLFWDPLITFEIDQRPYVQLTAEHMPYGQGPQGSSSLFINNGFPVTVNNYATMGDKGETIEQAQQISCTVDPTQVIDNAGAGTYTLAATAAGGVGVDAKIFLDTQYYRTLGI